MKAVVTPVHFFRNSTARLLHAGRLAFSLALAGGAMVGGQAAEYTYSTIAGLTAHPGSKEGAGGGGGFPLFNGPIGLVVNTAGNLYVADAGNNVIRMVTPAGVVTLFVGTPGLLGGTDGSKTDTTINLTFNSPQGPALDSAGNLYVADYNGSTIRKITPAGVVSTLAGTVGSSGNTDGTGAAARFHQPSGVAVDATGNVFVADSGNNTIRKITSAGVVTVFAGAAGVPGALDGTGTAARFNYPRGLAFDRSGNLLVADSTNNTIRKITSAGVVTTIAGSAGGGGSTDGAGGAARFNFPNSLAVDASGNIYVADESNHTIRVITSAGSVTTLAGLAGSTGRVDGTGNQARFERPAGVAVDGDGNVYVADYNNQLIRRVTRAGVVTTVAGVGGIVGSTDGSGYNLDPTLLRNPSGMTVTPAGVVYIADTGNNTIRMLTTAGVMTTLAGSPSSTGIADGASTVARFYSPSAVAADAAGNLYVADTGNHLVRKISGGQVTTLAGGPLAPGSVDGPSLSARFNSPSGIALDGAGALYVADYGNHTIRRIGTDGVVSTFAGTAGVPGSADGIGAAARFNFPRSLAVDGVGNIYVADSGNHLVRKITPSGSVSTLAGSAGLVGSADGLGGAARFNGPTGLSVDAAGNVFVADTNNSTIRLVTSAGQVTTIGGTAGSEGTADGTGAAARFNHPNGLAVNAAGGVYIADTFNQTLRLGTLPGYTGGGTGSGGSGGSSGGGTGSGGSGGSSGGGSSGGGSSGSGTIPGAGLLLHPTGMTGDVSGNYYVTDTANHCIRKISSTGVTTVFAGKEGTSGSADGTGTAALFNSPTGITTDVQSYLYVCDTGNATIRKIDLNGVVTTVAGTAGTRGTADGTGAAAQFNNPVGIAYNSSNTSLYVSDSVSCTIRRITSAGVVTTLAGTAKKVGDADGVGANALFNNPEGLTIDANNSLFVADTYNHTIRKVTTLRMVKATAVGTILTDGTVLVVITDPGLAGSPVSFNVPVTANDDVSMWVSKVVTYLNAVTAVAARYTAVQSGSSIVLVYLTSDDGVIANLSLANGSATGVTEAPTSTATSISGTVTTVAGSAGISGAYDGTGAFALFNLPRGLTVDSNGSLYVADTGNSAIRWVSTRGQVVTLAGIPGISGFRDGAGTTALFNQPQGMLNYNSIWVVDSGNSVIRYMPANGATVNSLALSLPSTTTSSSSGGTSSSGSGGGAPSLWFVTVLGLLGAARRLRGRAD